MTDKSIEIPRINLQQVVVRIVGTTPLLTNRFSEEAIASIKGGQEGRVKVAKAPRDPEAEFIAAQHRMPGGQCAFPAGGMKKALVNAGFRFSEEKGPRLRGALNVIADLIPIEAPAPRMRTDPIRLQGTKSSLAYRPMFHPWSMDVPVSFNADIIGLATVLHLFEIAGFAVGIGAWRPECNGTFGQFVLDEQAMANAA